MSTYTARFISEEDQLFFSDGTGREMIVFMSGDIADSDYMKKETWSFKFTNNNEITLTKHEEGISKFTIPCDKREVKYIVLYENGIVQIKIGERKMLYVDTNKYMLTEEDSNTTTPPHSNNDSNDNSSDNSSNNSSSSSSSTDNKKEDETAANLGDLAADESTDDTIEPVVTNKVEDKQGNVVVAVYNKPVTIFTNKPLPKKVIFGKTVEGIENTEANKVVTKAGKACIGVRQLATVLGIDARNILWDNVLKQVVILNGNMRIAIRPIAVDNGKSFVSLNPCHRFTGLVISLVFLHKLSCCIFLRSFRLYFFY